MLLEEETMNQNTAPSLALVVEGVTKSFRLHEHAIRVLDGVSLTVCPGEVVVISGRSGAGKSTLLALLAGLDTADSGTITLLGQSLGNMGNEALADLRRRSVGFVFQNFQLLPSWTAAENVDAVLMNAGIHPTERRERVIGMLTDLGLQNHLDNLPGELSVGQQQRVALARTLVNRPQIIFADEPTGDVDNETAGEMLELLMERVRSKEVTLVVATHGAFPLDLADRRLTLRDGRLEENE